MSDWVALLASTLVAALRIVWVAVRQRSLNLFATVMWYRADPDVRRGNRFTSTVWGAVLVLESAIRVPLVYLLPIDVMVGLSTATPVVAFVGPGPRPAERLLRSTCHEHVVDVTAVEQELLPEHPLLDEPAPGVQPPGPWCWGPAPAA